MGDQLQRDAGFWDRAARKYAASSISDVEGYENTLKAVSQHISHESDVIEIGAGTGTTALRLANAAGTYLATDISPEMIKIAQEKAAAETVTSLTFDVGEPVSAGWADDSYDVALAFNVLHLAPSALQTLTAIHQLLRPGGLFISKTPCLKMMNPMIRVAIPVLQIIGKAPSVAVLKPKDIEDALHAANFEIVERSWHGTKGKDSRPYFVARAL